MTVSFIITMLSGVTIGAQIFFALGFIYFFLMMALTAFLSLTFLMGLQRSKKTVIE